MNCPLFFIVLIFAVQKKIFFSFSGISLLEAEKSFVFCSNRVLPMVSPVKMHKAVKYAIKRSSLLEEMFVYFMKSFGCCRKVYNLYVDYLYDWLEKAGYTGGDILPKIKFPEVTSFKKEFPYLKEVDSLALCNEKIHFEKAVKHFNKDCDHVSYTKRAKRRSESGTEPLSFRGLKGMPRFHAKAKGDYSFTTNCQYPDESNTLKRPTVRLEGNKLFIPKQKQGIELVMHRPFPNDVKIDSVTISMDTDGSLYASIEYTYTLNMDITLREAVLNNDTSILDKLDIIALDYSQPHFYVDSNGETANPPHAYRKSEEKLARLQKELSRMQKDSNNYKKKKAEIDKLHTKIKNQRRDYIEKESTYLARRYDVCVVEDIDLRAMAGSLTLGKNLCDNGFGMFRDRLMQKLVEKGSILVKVDRFFPSTKTCSHCGYVNKDVTLGVQEWDCPVCGTHHLRDDNAAINIREEGKRILFAYFLAWLEEDQKARDQAEARTTKRKNKSKNQKKQAA